MSYSLIDLPVYEQVANSVYFYSVAPRNMFLELHGRSMEVIKQHVKNWCDANEQTYLDFYQEWDKNEKRHLKLSIYFNSMPLTRYQLIKYLESIKGNITPKVLKDSLQTHHDELIKSYNLLRNIIHHLALSIVHDHPMYVNAKP